MIFDMKLKTADKGSMDAALSPWRSVCEIDEIGVIYQPTGEVVSGENGDEPVMAPIEGWHVNVRTTSSNAADELRHLEVTPENPVSVWL